MKNLDAIARYLSIQAAQMKIGERDSGGKPRPFVTISRQAGAGGHALADILLEVFAAQEDSDLFGGWRVFDRRLCEIVAEHPTYKNSMPSLLNEEYRHKAHDFFHQIFHSTVDQDVLMAEVFRVVRTVAEVGKSVIVGRAGSEVTRGQAPGVSVRLIAPEDVRIQGVMDFYGLDEKTARAEATKLDLARARLLKTHFKADIDDPLLYDAVWNTGDVSVDVIAECIVQMLRHRVANLVGATP